jgi:4-amino-4-deoxy-L-arabinose transferase-like glycosyltransferase
MTGPKKSLFFLIFLFVIFLSSAYLRIYNLGYSDYQGDEIKAFFNPKTDGDYFQFLLDQRKGPNQFIVTGLLKEITNNYDNYALTRLPFALAGLFSVAFFYLIVKKFFNTKVAIYSSIFFATNGFLIAFSRIVQYQSFVILFGLIAIYLYQKYRESNKYYLITLSFVSLAVATLFHYDGLFFGLPILYWAIQELFNTKKPESRKLLTNLIVAGLVFVVMLASFYIPFVMNLTDKTKDYWLGRISGEVSNKVSSSYYLFTIYQPIYVIHFYLILIILGLGFAIYPLLHKYLKIKYLKDLKFDWNVVNVLIWALIPFAFLEGVVSIPGTHIYTYLIPAMILMGYGIDKAFEVIKNKALQILGYTALCGLTLFLFLQANAIFVDHTKEYPWEDKKFLVFTLIRPSPVFHLSMFGFPYNREWKQIAEFLNQNPDDYYSTNERVTVTRYLIKNPKDGNQARYFVFIENPQMFTNDISNSRARTFIANNKPIKEIKTQSGNKVLIYEIPKNFSYSAPATKTIFSENLDE